MRPTLSELGEYDGTALMEFKTKKNIVYRINRETVCTYEMDDTPPFEVNDQALDISIEMGMLLNANIADELHITRKQYLDGSIPTGFQRTGIVSVGGEIPYKDRKIRLIQMTLEEDSCREYSDVGHERIYLTDRLGMPLIETVTYPDMKTPQEVAEVNDLLRRLARNTGKVRTGIGAAREDVNVSVTGGTRIEIKGVPKIKKIPLLTYNEAMRQWNLLKIKEELNSRKINAETFKADVFDVSDILRGVDLPSLKKALDEGKQAKAVVLKGYKGILNKQTQTNTYFDKEISDRVRVIACLDQLPNIIHSEEQNGIFSTPLGDKINEFTKAEENDSIVIVWGDEQDSETAVKEIKIRAKEAAEVGVPSETRQALRDGTTGFERILPGPDRMYPDTDLPPKVVPDDRKQKIRKDLPKPFWVYESKFKELGIPEDTVSDLADSKFPELFMEAATEWKLDPTLCSVALIQFRKRLKKKGYDVSALGKDETRKILEAYKNGDIVREGVFEAMKRTADAGEFGENALPKPCDEAELRDAVKNSVEKVDSKQIHNKDKRPLLILAETMRELRGRVAFEKANEAVENYLKEEQNG